MERSYYGHRNNGWDTTSHDYHSHLAKMSRTPSVLPNVPHYPTVHRIFKNKVTYEDENGGHHKHYDPDVPEKVEVIEYERVVERSGDGDCQVIEETIDVEADGYIQQKHKGFELCKWKTFKH